MTTRCNALQAYMAAGTTRALAATVRPFMGAGVDMWSPISTGTHADPKHGQPLRTKDSP
jgi:hypothetical protein